MKHIYILEIFYIALQFFFYFISVFLCKKSS